MTTAADNTAQPAIGGKHLHAIERWTMILSAVVLAASYFVFSGRMLLGVTLGAGLMVINAYALRRVGARVFAAHKRPGLAILLLNVKLVVLIAGIYVAIRYLPVDPIGFLIGMSVFPVAVVVAAVRIGTSTGEASVSHE